MLFTGNGRMENSMNQIFRNNKQGVAIFVLGCFAGILGALPFISNLIFSIDDYHLWNVYDINWEMMGYNFYSTGRYIEGIISEILYRLNLQPLNRPMGALVFIAAESLFGTLMGELLQIQSNMCRAIFCILVVLNPFSAEIYYYSSITVYSGFAMFFLSFGLLFSFKYEKECKIRNILCACIFYYLSLGVYQIFYPLVLFAIILMIIRDYNENTISWRRYSTYLEIYIFTFLLYYIVLKIMYVIVPPTFTYEGIDIVEFLKALFTSDYYVQLFNVVKKYYGNTIMNSFLSLFAIIACSVLCSLIGVIYSRKKGKLIYMIACLLYIFLGLVLCIGFGLPRLKDISARSFTSYGVYLAGLLLIDYYFIKGSKAGTKQYEIMRKAFIVIFVGIVFVNGSLIGRAANNIIRLNEKEANMVNRIVYRMEEHDGFTGYEPLVVLGVPQLSNVTDKSLGNFGEPASVSFSKVYLFNEISGYNFTNPSNEQLEKAIEMMDTMSTWPGKDSVKYADGMFVVRLYW